MNRRIIFCLFVCLIGTDATPPTEDVHPDRRNTIEEEPVQEDLSLRQHIPVEGTGQIFPSQASTDVVNQEGPELAIEDDSMTTPPPEEVRETRGSSTTTTVPQEEETESISVHDDRSHTAATSSISVSISTSTSASAISSDDIRTNAVPPSPESSHRKSSMRK